MTVSTTVKTIQDIMHKDAGVDGDAQRISQLTWMLFLKIIDDQDDELALMVRGYKPPIPAALRWRNWAKDPEGITGDRLLDFVNGDLFPKLKNLAVSKDERRRIVREVFADANNYMKSGQLMRQVINKIQTIDFNKLAERQHFGEIYEKILNDLQSAGNAGEFYTPRALTSFMAARTDPKPDEIVLDPACGTGGFLTCAIRHMRDKHIKAPKQESEMQSNLSGCELKHLPYVLCVTNMLLHNIASPSFVKHDDMLARPLTSYTNSDRVDVVLTNPPFGGAVAPNIERIFSKEFRTKETADLFLVLIMRLLKPGGRCAIVLPDGTLFGEGVKTRIKKQLLETCNLHTIVRLPNSVFRPYASIGTNLLFFTKGEETRHIWYYEHKVPEGQAAYSKTKPIRLEHLQPCADWWDKRRENENAWKVDIKEIRERNYNLDIKNPHGRKTERQHTSKQLLSMLHRSFAESNELLNRLKEELK
ncbi:MAG: class I SAM-dependent DNA methyltransferase [Candidatus Dadabacteria bacterium]|nr:class I SAM-dependent DNA methyltransferase [Candidatus Dadabacteria bacterium]